MHECFVRVGVGRVCELNEEEGYQCELSADSASGAAAARFARHSDPFLRPYLRSGIKIVMVMKLPKKFLCLVIVTFPHPC